MHRRFQSMSTVKRSLKRVVRFNIIISGASGTGKSTFINTLCGRQLVSTTEWLDQDPGQVSKDSAVKLRVHTDDIAESDTGNITLRLIETCGLGDALNAAQGIKDVVAYVEAQFDEVLAEESRIRRNPRFIDNRVHALVHLIEPTGHGLREFDVEFLRAVGTKVNVIPAIAKADSLTRAELLLNKRLIREDIQRYGLPVYQFQREEGEDQDTHYLETLQETMPFAVVGSNQFQTVGDRIAPTRTYPFGSLVADDPGVSDLGILRDLLLYSHLDDLRDTTFDFLYENHRTERLSCSVAGVQIQERSVSVSVESPRPDEEHAIQAELEAKRDELRRREQELKELEARLRKEAQALHSPVMDNVPTMG